MQVDPTRLVSEQGVRVIRAGDRLPDVCSGDMVRQAAIARGTVDAEKIWMGWVELGPGLLSAVHHHGEAESGIFIVSGHARFYSGADLQDIYEAGEGDFIWVPPDLIHVEQNVSDQEPVRMVVARSTQETLVFNVDAPAGWTPTPSGRGVGSRGGPSPVSMEGGRPPVKRGEPGPGFFERPPSGRYGVV